MTDTQRNRDADARHRALVEHSLDVITVLDGEGNFRYANPAIERVTGYDPDSLVGEAALDYVHPDDRRRLVEYFTSLVEGDESTTRVEFRFRTTDGDWIWVETRGHDRLDERLGGYVLVTREITERKEYERTLSALHEATRDLFDAESNADLCETVVRTARELLDMPISGIWLYDADEHALLPVAQARRSRDLLDELPVYRPGNSLSWEVFETGEYRVYDDVREAGPHNDETVIAGEMILPLGDYGVINIGSVEVDPFDEADVKLARILAANTEAALESVRREAQLNDRQRELERQNERLESFASLVSHDLRNPLTVATGRLELLAEECDSDHIPFIGRALDRMDTLIEDVLTLARQGTHISERERVSLPEVAESAWAIAGADGATLTVDPDLGSVSADRTRLSTLFENLFRNSVEHGSTSNRPEAGDAVEHGGGDVTVTVGALEEGFYVEDDGPGIPPEERERAFETGYSTAAEGTGFGLSIVREIAEAHGWTVDVTESESGGARFEVRNAGDAGATAE